jgi:hypothetical protein
MIGGWDVQVHRGAAPVQPTVDTGFGNPSVTLGEDGSLSDPTVPLIYQNVSVVTTDDSVAYVRKYNHATLQPDGSWRCLSENLRVMDVVASVTFDGHDSLRVTGMEARDDGVMVLAIWEVSPASGDDSDDGGYAVVSRADIQMLWERDYYEPTHQEALGRIARAAGINTD